MVPRLSDKRRLACFLEQREVDAEAFVGGLRAGDRLKRQIDRRALVRSASSVVVTCASTQVCVGMSSLARISSSIDSSVRARSGCRLPD